MIRPLEEHLFEDAAVLIGCTPTEDPALSAFESAVLAPPGGRARREARRRGTSRQPSTKVPRLPYAGPVKGRAENEIV